MKIIGILSPAIKFHNRVSIFFSSWQKLLYIDLLNTSVFIHHKYYQRLFLTTHREGILFALSRPGDNEDADPYTPPPYLDFLLVLTEFCHRLLYVDRVGENSGVVPFLFKQLPSDLIDKVRRKELRGWEPLAIYRDLTLPQQTRSAMQRTNRKRPQRGNNFYLICKYQEIHRLKLYCEDFIIMAFLD